MTASPAHFLNMLKFSTGLDALSLTQFGGGDSFDKFSVALSGRRLLFLSRSPVKLSPTSGRIVINNPYQSRTQSDRAILRRRALLNERPNFDTPEMDAARQVEQGKRLFGLDLDLFPTPPSKSAVLRTLPSYVNPKNPSIAPKFYYEGNPVRHYPSRPDGRLPMAEVGIGDKSMLVNRRGEDILDGPFNRNRPPANRYSDPLSPDSVPGTAEAPYVRIPLSDQDAEDSLRAALWSVGTRIR
jgi:hypothetical protein